MMTEAQQEIAAEAMKTMDSLEAIDFIPRYVVLRPADWLPIEDLPAQFLGIPVEWSDTLEYPFRFEGELIR